MKSETVNEITFSLRIPKKLNEKIVADAEQKRRSRQAHITYLLEQLFSKNNGIGKTKEANK